jgi:hypothetical protein
MDDSVMNLVAQNVLVICCTEVVRSAIEAATPLVLESFA